ncbi:hypothetical protein ABPG74_010907 [Tetrahymena malaccensis]
MSKQSNLSEDYVDLFQAYKAMQKTCMYKCLEDVSKPILNVAEQSCMHRCIVKYRHALGVGAKMFLQFENEIKKANDLSKTYPIAQNPLQL